MGRAYEFASYVEDRWKLRWFVYALVFAIAPHFVLMSSVAGMGARALWPSQALTALMFGSLLSLFPVGIFWAVTNLMDDWDFWGTERPGVRITEDSVLIEPVSNKHIDLNQPFEAILSVNHTQKGSTSKVDYGRQVRVTHNYARTSDSQTAPGVSLWYYEGAALVLRQGDTTLRLYTPILASTDRPRFGIEVRYLRRDPAPGHLCFDLGKVMHEVAMRRAEALPVAV